MGGHRLPRSLTEAIFGAGMRANGPLAALLAWLLLAAVSMQANWLETERVTAD
jgi:hypothetical protein